MRLNKLETNPHDRPTEGQGAKTKHEHGCAVLVAVRRDKIVKVNRAHTSHKAVLTNHSEHF